MSKTKTRRTVPPIVAVLQPVAKRLARMEDLLIEMRNEQDVQLKKIAGLAGRLDALTEVVSSGTARPPRRQ